jgi:phosphoribosylformylglycinamidine cyclo-ligase
MYKTFNCGIGMAIVLSKAHVEEAKKLLSEAGETVYEIGHIRTQHAGEAPTVVV